MRRGLLILVLMALIGCSNHKLQPINPTLPPPTIKQAPSATPTNIGTLEKAQIQFIANVANQQHTAVELYTIDGNGGSKLQKSLECLDLYCEQTQLYAIPNQAVIALVVGDNGSGGELYQVSYQNWQATKIADQVAMDSLAIMPDGSTLAFLRLRTDTSAPVALGSIWVYEFANQNLKQVSEWMAFYADVIWLDNQQMLFSRAKNGTPPTNWHTWLLDLNNPSQPQEISAGRIQAVIGNQQLFIEHEQARISNLNPLIQIQRYDLRQGISTPISDWYDRYSQLLQIETAPNQQQVVLITGGEPEMLGMTTPPQLGIDLQIIDAAGVAGPTSFIECTECWPSWSSEGQTLLFFDYNHERLVLVDPSTGAIDQQKLPERFYPHPSHSLYHILKLDH